MNDPIDFTPKEKLIISLYKEPDSLFRRALVRNLTFIFPSVGLIAYSWFADDIGYGVLGYLLLLFQALYKLVLLRRGTRTLASIISKYEARLQMREQD